MVFECEFIVMHTHMYQLHKAYKKRSFDKSALEPQCEPMILLLSDFKTVPFSAVVSCHFSFRLMPDCHPVQLQFSSKTLLSLISSVVLLYITSIRGCSLFLLHPQGVEYPCTPHPFKMTS